MKRLLAGAAVGMLALLTVAGPVSARTFGSVYANDAIYRVFGNAANVPDGTGTDPFATFTNSTNADQKGVAEFAPGSPTGHHGGRWAVYPVTWATGVTPMQATNDGEVLAWAQAGLLTIASQPVRLFECTVNPVPPTWN